MSALETMKRGGEGLKDSSRPTSIGVAFFARPFCCRGRWLLGTHSSPLLLELSPRPDPLDDIRTKLLTMLRLVGARFLNAYSLLDLRCLTRWSQLDPRPVKWSYSLVALHCHVPPMSCLPPPLGRGGRGRGWDLGWFKSGPGGLYIVGYVTHLRVWEMSI